MNDMLADSADRLFASIATPAAVRAIEDGGDATGLWRSVEEAGFCDALTPEDAGGAGLSLHEAFGLLVAAGRHALPVPLAITCWARLLLAQRGKQAPAGPIALAAAPLMPADGGWTARTVPFGRLADWVVVQRGGTTWMLPTALAEKQDLGVHGSMSAHLRWSGWPDDAAIELGETVPCLETGAVLWAALMAGALDKALDMTVQFANERVQFGRSIGKFQALQQNISEIAELARAAMLAAEMGAQAGLPQSPSSALHAALAKARTSAAVPRVVAVAHAVHGAMGITAEYPLHLWTRRLHEWRLDYHAETFWHRRIGGALLNRSQGDALDFVLDALAPVETA